MRRSFEDGEVEGEVVGRLSLSASGEREDEQSKPNLNQNLNAIGQGDSKDEQYSII